MFKKLFVTVLAVLFTVTVAACSTPAKQPWDGVWTADGYTATVQDKTIEIKLVNKDTKTEVLYWKGTFAPKSDLISNEEITSNNDVAATKKSMFGSQDPTKVFTAKDSKMTFTIEMMGVKRNIELSK